MTGDEVELDSFFRKFLGLRKFGRNATLHMESRPDGRTFVNLQLEVAKIQGPGPHDGLPLAPAPVRGGEAPVRGNQPDVAVVRHGDGDAPGPARGGEAPVRNNQRDEHCEHFVQQHGGRNGRRPEKSQRRGIRSRDRRRLRREADQMKMEAEQASNDVESNIETTEEVEISKLTDDTTEEVHSMLKTTKLDAERDASINEIEDKEESAATIKDNKLIDSESFNDDREELEKANKTILELSKNLKIKEAELAHMKSCYSLYIEKSKSVIRSLEHDAAKRSEAEE